MSYFLFFFFFQAEDGIRDYKVTGVQTCALPPTQDDLHAVSSGNLASIFINHTRLFSGVLELRTSSCRRRAESLAASAGTILYAERRSVFPWPSACPPSQRAIA